MQAARKNQKYFSKANMIEWINTQFNVHIVNLEELSNGVVLAKMMAALKPTSIQMKKVILEPKGPFEWNKNLRLVEKAFELAGFRRPFEVDKVSKGLYPVIWETCQFLREAFIKSEIPIIEPKGEGQAREPKSEGQAREPRQNPEELTKSVILKTRKPEENEENATCDVPIEHKNYDSIPKVKKENDPSQEKELLKLRMQQEETRKILEGCNSDDKTKLMELKKVMERGEESMGLSGDQVRNAIISEIQSFNKEGKASGTPKPLEKNLENKENQWVSVNKPSGASNDDHERRVFNPFASQPRIQNDHDDKASITKAMGLLEIHDISGAPTPQKTLN